MRTLSLLAIVTLGSLAACGQKGPLVLPDAQRPHKKIGLPKPPTAPAPAPATPPSPASPTTPQR